jgi:single-stranded-DNA-specific exonuclease
MAVLNKNIWRLADQPPAELVALLRAEMPKVSADLVKLMVQRGIRSVEEARVHFRPELSQLHDPFLMKNMDKAVNRLTEAIDRGEKILVYGDYDVDGTTAVASMYSFLRELTPHVAYYLPDRYTEGYGISTAGIDFAKANGFGLIIALDCGIKAVEKIDYASSLGIDFIICDHHTPGETLPRAVAVLDPKQSDCPYPYKELSGCGVGFKLIQAFILHHGMDMRMAWSLLDLLAISIGADIVHLTGENRVLAHYGLESINTNPRPGIRAMLKLAGKELPLDIGKVVFILAPRINAAGRISHAKGAVELLLARTDEEAETLSRWVEETNKERREFDKDITTEALAEIERIGFDPGRRSTVVCSENWHKGVIGIVASRLIERHYRPTVVLVKTNGVLTGSARSIEGFDLYDALDRCSHLFHQFGGHMMAAGLKMPEENLEAFREQFEQICRERLPQEPRPVLEADLITDLGIISFENLNLIERMGPYGPANMEPVFWVRGLMNAGYTRKVGGDEAHLKVNLRDREGRKLNGIGFGLGPRCDALDAGHEVDILFSLQRNEYNGNVSVQAFVKDIKLAEDE